MRQRSLREPAASQSNRNIQYRAHVASLLTACLLSMLCAWSAGVTAEAVPLTFKEAVVLAVSRADPTLIRHDERAAALENRALAAAQLPDPEVQFGFANWPVDSFDYDQEPMTQIQVGLRQRFPRGDTLSILGARRESEAQLERARRTLRLREIARATRDAWLELYYLSHARDVVDASRLTVAELVAVVRASFATGLQNNQDLLRAELELSLLDDRALEIERLIQRRRADLGSLIGEPAAARNVARALPSWPALPRLETIDGLIVNHPAVAVEDAAITGREHDVSLAHEQYDPGWALEAGYGMRSGGRADFASVMVTVEVPIFTDKRQDRELAASEQERAAAILNRDAILLSLRRQARHALADAERFTERVVLYREIVVDRADGTAAAALDSYQSQVADFAELIRSRLAALDTGLKLKRLEADLGKAYADLAYLLGER